MKKKKSAPGPPADVADQKLVDSYARLIQKRGRDWHLTSNKKKKKSRMAEYGGPPASITDHLVRRANIEFDRQFKENVRQWNLSPDRLKDRMPMVYNGSYQLEPGDVPYIQLDGWPAWRGRPKPEPKLTLTQRKVLKAMSDDKWMTSEQIATKKNLDKKKVIKALKSLVSSGRAEKRKKGDNFQYRLKREAVS